MEFKQAVEYMDPMQVTDYLHKILDFLKRDNHERYFPNISPYVETFLVSIVTNIRNLKCDSFSYENRRFASEIIGVLETNKDVFKLTHAYENGKLAKNVLVYKKIFNIINGNTEPWLKVVMDSMTKTQINPKTKKKTASKEARQITSNKCKLTPSDIHKQEKRKAKPVVTTPKSTANKVITAERSCESQKYTETGTQFMHSKAFPMPKRKRRRRKKKTKPQASPNTLRINNELKHIQDSSLKDATNTLNNLFVAVMAEPFADLTSEQVESIKETLESRIQAIDSPRESYTPYWPSFRGKPLYSDGVLKLQCEGTKDVEWLKDTVETLVSPIPGTVLVVKRQTDVPKRVKSAVLLPNCSEEIEMIRQILISQNKWYQVGKWPFYHTRRYKRDPPDTFLVFGIPVDEIPVVLGRGRRLSYKLDNAYIRFFGNTGRLQDVPPEYTEIHLVTKRVIR